MYNLIITEKYQKRAEKFLTRHPNIVSQYDKALNLLCLNPSHPSLRMHKLSGRFADVFSVSINISYRLIINFIIHENQIVPIDIGSHDEVY